MNFAIWLENQEDEDGSFSDDELYFSIGHGDYNDDAGFEPEYIVWAFVNGKIETSKRIKIGRNGPINDKTHGSLWGHHITDRDYKGRYEPQTGRLSIVKPRSRSGVIPQLVMDTIRNKFRYITKIYEF